MLSIDEWKWIEINRSLNELKWTDIELHTDNFYHFWFRKISGNPSFLKGEKFQKSKLEEWSLIASVRLPPCRLTVHESRPATLPHTFLADSKSMRWYGSASSMDSTLIRSLLKSSTLFMKSAVIILRDWAHEGLGHCRPSLSGLWKENYGRLAWERANWEGIGLLFVFMNSILGGLVTGLILVQSIGLVDEARFHHERGK